MTQTKLSFRNRTLLIADSAMENVLSLARKAARNMSPVLICGESGTGKELIARYIHEMSGRANGPFIAVNCAAIPEGLMEAELFGFEKGAFTGAIYQRIGRFEAANGGTLLLDEMSEMPLPLQAKLLRVLQEGEIDRLGARDTIRISSRIIATSNKDPLKLVHEGRFREDLFYRLNVIRIECPALRDRKEAIENLAKEFLSECAQRHEKESLKFSSGAMEKLKSHIWNGNVRELQNVIERSVLTADGFVVTEGDIEFFCSVSKGASKSSGTLAQMEREHILGTLEQNQGNRSSAARKLGISVRTLRNKLKEYSV